MNLYPSPCLLLVSDEGQTFPEIWEAGGQALRYIHTGNKEKHREIAKGCPEYIFSNDRAVKLFLPFMIRLGRCLGSPIFCPNRTGIQNRTYGQDKSVLHGMDGNPAALAYNYSPNLAEKAEMSKIHPTSRLMHTSENRAHNTMKV